MVNSSIKKMNYEIYRWAVFFVCLLSGHVSSCGQEPKGIDFGEEGFIASIQQNHHLHLRRRRREATINDRKSCGDLGAVPPKTRVNTGQRLEDLRKKLSGLGLSAFLIPSGDSH